MNKGSPDNNGQSSVHDESTTSQGKSKAVVPDPNFLISTYLLFNKKKKLDSYISGDTDEPMLQGKEVEEWLMGSGLSIPEATTGWTDIEQSNISGFLNTLRIRQKQKEIENNDKKDKVVMEDCSELEEWMFDSFNTNKKKAKDTTFESDGCDVPDEYGLDGNWVQDMPQFQNPNTTNKNNNKRSPYFHKDQIIEEDQESEGFVATSEQFGFKNLSSYIDQMDKWIEEGRTFK